MIGQEKQEIKTLEANEIPNNMVDEGEEEEGENDDPEQLLDEARDRLANLENNLSVEIKNVLETKLKKCGV